MVLNDSKIIIKQSKTPPKLGRRCKVTQRGSRAGPYWKLVICVCILAIQKCFAGGRFRGESTIMTSSKANSKINNKKKKNQNSAGRKKIHMSKSCRPIPSMPGMLAWSHGRGPMSRVPCLTSCLAWRVGCIAELAIEWHRYNRCRYHTGIAIPTRVHGSMLTTRVGTGTGTGTGMGIGIGCSWHWMSFGPSPHQALARVKKTAVLKKGKIVVPVVACLTTSCTVK